MASVGSLSVDLLLESSSFMNGMKKAAESSAETSRSIKEAMDGAKEAIVGLGEILAVDWFAEQVNKALEFAESIKKVEEATGLTTTTIQGFMYAASQAGVATDTSQQALVRFTKALGEAANGNQQILKVFKDLNVTSTDANTAIKQFSDGLEKVPTKAQKVADVTQVFGRNAAGLTPILEDGSKKLDAFTQSAQELGIILDGKVIDGAVDAEHKISALKMVISAEWANTIDQNATAIASLADSFIKMAGAVTSFMNSNPRTAMTLMGGIAGLALGKNPYAALAGGAAGFVAGDYMANNAAAQNPALTKAKDELAAAQANLEDAKKGATVSSGPWGLWTVRDTNKHPDMKQAQARLAAAQSKVDELSKSTSEGGEGGGGGTTLPPLKTHTPRDHSANQQSLYDRALGSEQMEGLGLQEQLAVNPDSKANFERQAAAYQYGYQDPNSPNWVGGLKDQEVDDNLASGKYGDKNSALAKARADELKHQNDLNGELQYELINRKLDAQVDADELSAKQSNIQNQEDLLNSQKDLARTAAQRASIGSQLIDLDFQQQKNALDAVIASKESTDAQKKEAAARLALLPTLQANAQASNTQANLGPMAAYLNSMPKTIGEINESLQQTASEGLGKFVDGISAAINGTGSLKSAFLDLGETIITGIEKIVLEESIIKPLGNLISSGLGSLSKGLGGLLGVGAHANGGMGGTGLTMVGERGPELMNIGGGSGASFINNAQLSRMTGGGGAVTVNSTVYGVNDPAQVRAMSTQTIAQATPALMKMSSNQTTKDLNRPRMR